MFQFTRKLEVMLASFLVTIFTLMGVYVAAPAAAQPIDAAHRVSQLNVATNSAAGPPPTELESGHARFAAADSSPSASAQSHASLQTQIDRVALLLDVQAPSTPFAEPVYAPQAAAAKRTGLLHDAPLPEPGGWTAIAATLALAVFFFFRRIL